jgi:hypothetical protein
MLIGMKKLRLALLIVLVLAIAIVFELTTFFGLPDNAARRSMLPEFEDRRAQWTDANITHYRMTIKVFRTLGGLCSPTQLEIRDGNVLSVKSVTTGGAEFEGLTVRCNDNRELEEQYADFTMDTVFSTAEHYLTEVTDIGTVITVKMEYDDAYGFPTLVDVFSPHIAHMPRMTITDFEVLTD